MIILLAIAAAIIGALFWADRRRYYRYRYGPILVSDEQDIVVGGNDAAYCDDVCDFQDEDSSDSADDYRDSASTAAGRDD